MKTTRLGSLLASLSLVACGVVAPLDDVDPATGSALNAGAGGVGAQGGSAGAGAQTGLGAQGGAGSGAAGAGAGGTLTGGQAGEGGAGEGGAGQGGAGEGGAGQGGAGEGGAGQAGAGQAGAGQAGEGGGAGMSGASGQSGAGNGGAGGGVVDGPVEVPGDPCVKPGARACSEGQLSTVLVCSDALTWVTKFTCSAGSNCVVSGPAAGECQAIVEGCKGKQPGDTFCDGAVLNVCGPDLTTVTPETCLSASHCEQRTGATCAVCLEGEFKCEAEKLSQCAPDHLSFKLLSECATADLCNATAGACTDKACSAGQFRCNGDELEKCASDQSGFELQGKCLPNLCDAASKQCDICEPNSVVCAGPATLLTCDAEGQSQASTACTGDRPFCSAGACVACTQDAECGKSSNPCERLACLAGVCSPVALGADEVTLPQTPNDCRKQVCDGQGSQVSQVDDTDAPVADSNVCTSEVCQNGVAKSVPVMAGVSCGANNKCDGDGTCGTCTEGQTRCNAGQNGTEVCTNGKFIPQNTCAGATKFCSAGACVGCLSTSDCPTSTNFCEVTQCMSNACVATPKPSNTPLPPSSQTPYDCVDSVCDGSGHPISRPNNSDIPLPTSDCLSPICSNGVPGSTPRPAGTACNGGASVCDGNGTCGVCKPNDVRCLNATTTQRCNPVGQWASNTTCAGATPVCSSGACVQCASNANCQEFAGCTSSAVCDLTTNSCKYTFLPVDVTCGDGIKCPLEACDDGNKTDCGKCNRTCSGQGSDVPQAVCATACQNGGVPVDVLGSFMIGCGGSIDYGSAFKLCAPGWTVAPDKAWASWHGSSKPQASYWVETKEGITSDTKFGPCYTTPKLSCPDAPAHLCFPGGEDEFKNVCDPFLGCGFEDPQRNDYFGGCGTNESAGTLCWKNPCADGSVEDYFAPGVAGCAGTVSFSDRKTLCGAGYHACAASEFAPKVGGTAPSHVYWTDTKLYYSGTTGSCSVNPTTGSFCGAIEQPGSSAGKVCPVSLSDAEGNTCTTGQCTLGGSSKVFGACGGKFAGTVCCADP